MGIRADLHLPSSRARLQSLADHLAAEHDIVIEFDSCQAYPDLRYVKEDAWAGLEVGCSECSSPVPRDERVYRFGDGLYFCSLHCARVNAGLRTAG